MQAASSKHAASQAKPNPRLLPPPREFDMDLLAARGASAPRRNGPALRVVTALRDAQAEAGDAGREAATACSLPLAANDSSSCSSPPNSSSHTASVRRCRSSSSAK